LQQIATVCELSATVSVLNPRLKQIATTSGSEDRLQTYENPVVEHKDGMRSG
jgi:hypothetical protein